ncbi:MAG TPA: DNA-3-methyladenine glycosylase [Fimbriimonadaceae bacterium]|nr:DNA-3-methyladenine glycosylase [Fimbriimonadaceae bacterium]
MRAPQDVHELRKRLAADIFTASKALLGAFLVKGEMRSRIVEVEGYREGDDPGSHAFRGPTPRIQVMYGAPGRAYVYFTYGMYWMLNVVAHEEGSAAAILVRAAQPLSGQDEMRLRRPKARRDEDLLSGPGKLCLAYGIDRRFNGMDLLDPTSELHIEVGPMPKRIVTGTRIGLAPGKGDELPWRFMDADHMRWVSKPHV